MSDRVMSMVDMSASTKEIQEMTNPSPPRYPWGLSISLCQDELEKLDLLDEDISVGDMLHLHCLTRVTSVSCNENEDGSHCRIELQITHISIPTESEDKENQVADKIMSKFYKK